jgi:guanylate kinase
MSDVQFDALVEENGFLEWAQVHGQRYGTLADDVTRVLASGRDVILEIDVQGGLQVKERYPDSVLVFIEPPSLDVLRQRLQGRGTESGEALERRLETARVELTYKERYNAVIINDSLAAAAAELTNLIVRHRSERGEA